MVLARYFTEKAGQVLAIAKQLKDSEARNNSVELALISLANEFMAKAEHEAALVQKHNGKKSN